MANFYTGVSVMGLRHRSIRLRVGILIAVPVLCLIAMYGIVASIALGNALAQAHAKSVTSGLLTPVSNFQQQVAAERHIAALALASPGSSRITKQLEAQEARTLRALAALRRAATAAPVADNASASERAALANLFMLTDGIVYINNMDSAAAVIADYDAIESAAYSVLADALDGQTSVPLVTQELAEVSLDRAWQTTLTEGDLLAVDMQERKFPASDRISFTELAGQRQSLVATAEPELQPAYRRMVTRKLTSAVTSSLTAAEHEVVSTTWRRGAPPARLAASASAFDNYARELDAGLTALTARLQAQAQHQDDVVLAELILAAGVGLLGTIGSIALSLAMGRGLVRQLRDLRESALSLAHEKLPSAISQVRAGQPVDVAEYEPGQVPTSSEIEQVQHAFSVVQQSAIQSALDEARLRRGISDVFRNLAGRSQSLLHRQLTLLDGMERRATEPEELEDLFKIDHLTTRMRRHAEGLIILSGETPARGWRQPVPLIDVLRAAVAEVEDYTRIRVLSRTSASVSGHAVADVIHLVAELAENATVFSPPSTPVRIQGDIVGRGFAIEIEDRGLGISQTRLDEINATLASPPQFDLAGSDRLGLFIAGQLARRHDIKITLRPSVYGGTTAIVLLPSTLVVEEDSYDGLPALPAARGDGPRREIAGRPTAFTQALLVGTDPDYTGFSLALPDPNAPDAEPQREPAASPVFAVSDDSDARVSTDELAKLGLPIRVRQASLAPQLRDSQPPLPHRVPPRPDAHVGQSPSGEFPDGQLPDEQPLAARPTGERPSGARAFGTEALPAQSFGSGSVGSRWFSAHSGTGRLGAEQSDAQEAGTEAPEHTAEPSPEAARFTMSALQRGWQLGRAEADHAFDTPADAAADTDPAAAADADEVPPGDDRANDTDARDNELFGTQRLGRPT